MASADQLEQRLRKVETSLAFTRGALAVGVVVILGYFGVTTWYQIPQAVDAVVNDQLNRDATATLNAALDKADAFLDHDAHELWPDGSYAILKHGDCPKGFREISGHARAFSVFERKSHYLKEAKMGDSQFKWHKDTTPHADFFLYVCVKDAESRSE